MNTTATESLGAFLKTGNLKKPVEVEIVDRSCGPGLSNGAAEHDGKYGRQLTLAFNVSGIAKRLSLPAKGQDAKGLQAMFGPAGESWIGRRILISEDPNLDILRVVPVG